MVATHNALSPEPALTPENAAVELRHFCGASLLGMWHFTRRKQVTLGERQRCDVFLSSEGLPTDRFALVRYEAPDYVLSVAEAMQGEIEVAGDLQDLRAYMQAHGHADPDAQETRTVVFAPSMRVLIHWGGTQLAMRLCSTPVAPAGRGRIWDAPYGYALMAAIMLHICCITALLLNADVPAALSQRGFDDVLRVVALLPMPPQPKTEVPQVRPLSTPKLPSTGAPPPRRAEPPRGLGSAPRLPQGHRGLNAMMALLHTGTLQGGAPTPSLEKAWTHPQAQEPGPPGGSPRPSPLPGEGRQSLPIAPILPSLPGGRLPNLNRPIFPGRRRDTDILLEPVRLEGALPRELIQAVITAQRAQVRFCYEQSLQHHPDLQGRILMAWTIGADGRVVAVRVEESSLTGDNGAVAACLLARINAWRFPPPAGGGTVDVRYPFVFRSA